MPENRYVVVPVLGNGLPKFSNTPLGQLNSHSGQDIAHWRLNPDGTKAMLQGLFSDSDLIVMQNDPNVELMVDQAAALTKVNGVW